MDTPEPSAFCHEIINANPYAFLDDAPGEERRVRAVHLRRSVREQGEGVGILDPAAIESVAQESWPIARDADELHDALVTLVVTCPEPAWEHWFDELVAQKRATTLHVRGVRFWTCAERLAIARIAYPEGSTRPDIAELAGESPAPERREDAFAEILRGFLESSGPASAAALAERFATDEATIEAALTRLETQGQVLRGRFSGAGAAEEFCNRRVLAAHRRQ